LLLEVGFFTKSESFLSKSGFFSIFPTLMRLVDHKGAGVYVLRGVSFSFGSK
jgi:hypothetical protein